MQIANLKHSKQRDAILEFLMTRKDHPTADTVYQNVREQFPNISLGTVYRNLTLLAEIGQIQKIAIGNAQIPTITSYVLTVVLSRIYLWKKLILRTRLFPVVLTVLLQDILLIFMVTAGNAKEGGNL